MFGFGLPEMIVVATAAVTFILFLIAAFLMPFFVFRIRNEVIGMNQKLSVLIELYERNKEPFTSQATPAVDDSDDWLTEDERRRIKKFYVDRKRDF
jgi:hypothetical protein